MKHTENTTGDVTGHGRCPTRFAAAGAWALALLLTGCSGAGGSDKDERNSTSRPSGSASTAGADGGADAGTDGDTGERADSGTDADADADGGTGVGTGPVKATVLTAGQVAAVLPREGDLPGWGGPTGAPRAVDLRKEDAIPVSCVRRKDPVCAGALFASSTLFTHREAGTITISVYAYDSASTATAAARPLLDRYAGANLLPGGIADSRLPGPVGETSWAKRGTNKLRSQGSVVVSRVGTNVLIVETGGLDAKIYTGAELVALGKVIADRSRQAQNGGTPSARLKNDALGLDHRRPGTS
ncbi:hypothetical protein SSCG_00260 [Streptomyces clavuligerus]|nr:hypothetical protein [Streptomyces clavuligerus]EDY47232.1 hypothetical protein SSCG_00260 [Streptomyces clavuligerus]